MECKHETGEKADAPRDVEDGENAIIEKDGRAEQEPCNRVKDGPMEGPGTAAAERPEQERNRHAF
jgi:hypothetical protein